MFKVNKQCTPILWRLLGDSERLYFKEKRRIMFFSFWHFAYLLLVLAVAAFLSLGLKGKSVMAKEKRLNQIAGLLLLAYLADFLATPLLTGQVGFDKLPFQVCTLSAVLICLSRCVPALVRFREPVMLMGLASAILYLVFPDATVRGYVSLNYSAVQSMTLHGLMAIYGVVAISTGGVKVSLKKLYQVPALASVAMGWSAVGYKLFSAGSHYSLTRSGYSPEDGWMLPLGAIVALTTVAAAACAVGAAFTRRKREKKEEMATIYIADRRAV